ncbi:DUF1343 domain-containing protein [Aquimarina sp. TRL1]|uniref:exo-beta-N-acetylmuramidase NamZ family protein n=1 Tax=Aquimarina sp. (strain TRL1) TaxID=2736252 RepID=UPI00158F0739|nr:DUF1343 domain-containing protein [Aquimarina sp. TRL1]QKX05634.1 DUF1343 domain-containing protein [Aquimarina sp. TRL1]
MVFIKHTFKNTFLFFFLLFISCRNNASSNFATAKIDSQTVSKVNKTATSVSQPPVVGANQLDAYLPLLKNKNVAFVGNQTSVIFRNDTKTTHLVDSLIAHSIKIKKVFSPEHGFRGKADAAEHVADGRDKKTGIPIISLYGKNKKPTSDMLKNIDIIVFDIQDVGVRFYTYISTLHYVMQSCAENQIPVIILDRPNPNGHYIDGPVLDTRHSSFVGMHPVPLVHGMTIGEYAQMINGEGWLQTDQKCNLTIIPVKNYTHTTPYHLPIRPSPNLPNDIAINLYPSLGLFEGTTINAGRGTEMQFQLIGAPELPKDKYPFSYTPAPNFGAKNPKHKGNLCNGIDLRNTEKMNRINLSWIINAYKLSSKKAVFFKNKSFTIHAGNTLLQKQIEQGVSIQKIRDSWNSDLNIYKKTRAKYLLYK